MGNGKQYRRRALSDWYPLGRFDHCSVQEFVDYVKKHAQGVPLKDVFMDLILGDGQYELGLYTTSEETDEEFQARLKKELDKQAEQEAKERHQLVELLKKYGDPHAKD